MEKYSQFRDKGTGIAPFLPVPTSPSGIYLPFHVFLFVVRVPLILFFAFAYFVVFSWLPIGSLGKKAALWLILGTPGIWWIDLQIDGVKKGSLTKKVSLSRLPQAGSIIVSSHMSPLDALYLAAIFDPLFTVSYPNSRLIRKTTLFESILRALSPPVLNPPGSEAGYLTTLSQLRKSHPDRVICILPECTTTNGRGVLPLSPSLLSAPGNSPIFPISLRYTPPDVTTPVPGFSEALRFLWNLCSKPTHTIRVRVAEATYNTSVQSNDADIGSVSEGNGSMGEVGMLDEEEKRVMDRIGEALARLGRVKRVSVGVKEKVEFVRMLTKQHGGGGSRRR